MLESIFARNFSKVNVLTWWSYRVVFVIMPNRLLKREIALLFWSADSIRLKQKPWCSSRGIPVYETDYKNSSSLSDLLDSVNAIALISFIQLVDETYVTIHESLITACRQSRSCKRFIPSEWIGNIDDFPQKPQFYYDSREPIRRRLRDTEDLQWTLVQLGFFMDYFLKSNKTYLRPIPDEFPVDPNGLKACIRGTGDEMQTFTLARDVAKAVVQLLMADTWVRATTKLVPMTMLIVTQETVTYVAGEWMTYNNAVEIMNEFYSPPLPFLETFSPFHGGIS